MTLVTSGIQQVWQCPEPPSWLTMRGCHDWTWGQFWPPPGLVQGRWSHSTGWHSPWPASPPAWCQGCPGIIYELSATSTHILHYTPGQDLIEQPRLIFPSDMISGVFSCHWQMAPHAGAQSLSAEAVCAGWPGCSWDDRDAGLQWCHTCSPHRPWLSPPGWGWDWDSRRCHCKYPKIKHYYHDTQTYPENIAARWQIRLWWHEELPMIPTECCLDNPISTRALATTWKCNFYAATNRFELC